MTETYHGFVDTATDALLLFDACCDGLLPRVQRRFGDRERQTIRSGAVYVWDEEETSMRRWTDGRTWSPSRVHGCFLIYYELEGRRHQFVNRSGQGVRRARGSPRSAQGKQYSASPSPLQTPYDPSPPNVMQKEQGLIKRALSLCTNDKRRLHLVCYYSREDAENGRLVSPSNDPRFAGVQPRIDRYPELANGLGRFDRYGSGRARAPAAARPWKAPQPGSPGRPFRAEPPPPPHQQYQQYQHHHQQPGPGPARHAYGLPSPCAAAPGGGGGGGSSGVVVYPEPPTLHVLHHGQAYPTPPFLHTSPKQCIQGQPPLAPAWQHIEAPRAYAAHPHDMPRRGSHVRSPDALWDGGAKGLLIQSGDAGRMPSAPLPPSHHHRPHSQHQHHNHHHRHPHHHGTLPPPPTTRLPPIEQLQPAAAQEAQAKGRVPRMNSEDMRQLASLRLSLQ
ncbi:Gluconate transport-inducing protein [Coemansia javaensis]|uniref:Gluconate transport-inducing protein n=1 Tax=Coemansia javaensis TaxID=2761396 RepID=A0A9W8H8P2_9FUNG|nr:Gluconate transport-inducing protein [Coemansia javaensis]